MPVILYEIAQKHSYDIERQHNGAGNNNGFVHSAGNVRFKHFSCYDGVYHAYNGDKERGKHIQRKHFFVWFIIAYKSFKHFAILSIDKNIREYYITRFFVCQLLKLYFYSYNAKTTADDRADLRRLFFENIPY